MSTRATYKIDFTTFYIHHDGYPEGAAEYFEAALKFRDTCDIDRAPNASFADDFMRANDRAELTESHDAHGDTEYRYTVTTAGDFRFGPCQLRLRAETADGRVIFNGKLREFIDRQLRDLNGPEPA